MKTKKILIGLVAVLALLVPTATAGAHGAVEANGNTWKSGSTVYGSGTINSSYNHQQLFIRVTLQRYFCGALDCPGWYNRATNTKTRTNNSEISLQVSTGCPGAVSAPFRVKVYYDLVTNGLHHTATIYRDQTPFACS
jgi:hypothetical protein